MDGHWPELRWPLHRSDAREIARRNAHYNKLPKGGHFAAWEQPQLLTEEMRVGFRSLRS
jgi:hypothetical protein